MFEIYVVPHAAEISGDAVRSATSKPNLFILSQGTVAGVFGAFLGRTWQPFGQLLYQETRGAPSNNQLPILIALLGLHFLR